MLARIRHAARQLFAERGYAAATTKEIARLADVSETLLFRYHGDKASLFNEVVTAPFQQLMDAFVRQHPDASADSTREADIRRFTRNVFELFEGNEEMFRALLTGPSLRGSSDTSPSLKGLTGFFAQAVEQVRGRYEAAGQEPPFDLAIGVRLGFGMIASSVLLRDSLFPDRPPERGAVIQALEQLIAYSLLGPSAD